MTNSAATAAATHSIARIVQYIPRPAQQVQLRTPERQQEAPQLSKAPTRSEAIKSLLRSDLDCAFQLYGLEWVMQQLELWPVTMYQDIRATSLLDKQRNAISSEQLTPTSHDPVLSQLAGGRTMAPNA